MWDQIRKLLGLGPAPNYLQLIQDGAVILDVRSKGEYKQGHIRGSMNISVTQLQGSLHLLKDKNRPIITCCASGMRSSTAKSILKSKGYTTVYNGGSWYGLQRKIN